MPPQLTLPDLVFFREKGLRMGIGELVTRPGRVVVSLMKRGARRENRERPICPQSNSARPTVDLLYSAEQAHSHNEKIEMPEKERNSSCCFSQVAQLFHHCDDDDGELGKERTALRT